MLKLLGIVALWILGTAWACNEDVPRCDDRRVLHIVASEFVAPVPLTAEAVISDRVREVEADHRQRRCRIEGTDIEYIVERWRGDLVVFIHYK